MNRKRIICLASLWLAVVLWMALIFSFSMDTAEESSQKSGNTLAGILRVIDRDFDSYSADEQNAILEQYSFLIRKTAHFAIYAVLGFLINNALTYGGLQKSKTITFSLLIGAAYAASDEIHQYFVPGRACQVRDVLIDSAGVLCGILVSLLFVKLIQYLSTRRKSKKQPSINQINA